MSKSSNAIEVSLREASLKRKLRKHLHDLGFQKSERGLFQVQGSDKEVVRRLHAHQRQERLSVADAFMKNKSGDLIKFFASGNEVKPERIRPILERVVSTDFTGDLFRLASLTWSVPVSNGFGRRMRYLVWDEYTEKLIGIFAIGDPVFNLSARDKLIGWSAKDRESRLVNIMDAYVLGALPPYNQLLGGKLIASVMRSREVYDNFKEQYGKTSGVISGKEKGARLLAVTTSSSMGRSSIYNRLTLDGIKYMEPIGYTGGWGHFHIPDNLFSEMREYLRSIGHEYADRHGYGQGPNWRLRTIRQAFVALGFRDDMLKHGIQREVFITKFASNSIKILNTGFGRPNLNGLLSVDEITERALERWIVPRAERRPEYKFWNKDNLMDLIQTSKEVIVKEKISRQ